MEQLKQSGNLVFLIYFGRTKTERGAWPKLAIIRLNSNRLDFYFQWNSSTFFFCSFHSSEETYLILESVEHYTSRNTKFHYAKCLYDIWGVFSAIFLFSTHKTMWQICIKCEACCPLNPLESHIKSRKELICRCWMGGHLGGEHWISVYERQRKLKRLLEIEIMLLLLYWLALLFNVSVIHRAASEYLQLLLLKC